LEGQSQPKKENRKKSKQRRTAGYNREKTKNFLKGKKQKDDKPVKDRIRKNQKRRSRPWLDLRPTF